MTVFEIVTIAQQQAAVVRAELPMEQLPGLFHRAFDAVQWACDEQGVPIVGPPFGFYPRMPGATVAVAAGFPVARPVVASGEVEPLVLPGGRAVRGMHIGPFEGLARSYDELVRWAASAGHTLGDAMWESYLSDPSAVPDPANWQTLLTWPLRDA
jgi:effector-binding domain-containing protein